MTVSRNLLALLRAGVGGRVRVRLDGNRLTIEEPEELNDMTFADLEAFQKAHALQLRIHHINEAEGGRWHALLFCRGPLDLEPKQLVAHASHPEWLGALQGAIDMWRRKRGGAS